MCLIVPPRCSAPLRFAFLVAARLSALAPVRPEPLVAYVLHLPLPRRMSTWPRCTCCCCCCRCCCRRRCCCRCRRCCCRCRRRHWGSALIVLPPASCLLPPASCLLPPTSCLWFIVLPPADVHWFVVAPSCVFLRMRTMPVLFAAPIPVSRSSSSSEVELTSKCCEARYRKCLSPTRPL